MKIEIKDITKQAIIAAVYVALTYLFMFMSFEKIQFRVSEMLMVLPLFNKKHSIGVVLGCFIANLLFSPFGMVDVMVGTFATLIACAFIILLKSKYLTPVIAALANGVIIGLMIYFMSEFTESFFIAGAFVFIGEFAVVSLGVVAYMLIVKNEFLCKLLRE